MVARASRVQKREGIKTEANGAETVNGSLVGLVYFHPVKKECPSGAPRVLS